MDPNLQRFPTSSLYLGKNNDLLEYSTSLCITLNDLSLSEDRNYWEGSVLNQSNVVESCWPYARMQEFH